MTFLYVQCFYILFTFYGIFQQKSPHLFSNKSLWVTLSVVDDNITLNWIFCKDQKRKPYLLPPLCNQYWGVLSRPAIENLLAFNVFHQCVGCPILGQ